MYLFAQRGAPPIVRLLNVYAGDDTKAAVEALRPLLEIGPLLDQQAALLPYPTIVPPYDNDHYRGQMRPLISNGLADHLTPELSELLAAGLRTRVAPWVGIRSIGGAVNDVDPSATAYAHRHQNFFVNSVGLGAREDDFLRHWDGLRPHLDGLYLNFETDPRPEWVLDAFPPSTLARLRVIKERCDPDNLFQDNFNVAPRELVGARTERTLR